MNSNDELEQTNMCERQRVCVCVLDTKPSHIPSKVCIYILPHLRKLLRTQNYDTINTNF